LDEKLITKTFMSNLFPVCDMFQYTFFLENSTVLFDNKRILV